MIRQSYESVLTVTSPLVHSDERVEIMQRFRREPFLVAGELLEVPVYSGNAIRGMLRRAAALRLCSLLGVADRSLPTDTFYLLFSGGYLQGSSDYAHRVEETQRLRGLLPMIGLLGCSWGSRVLHGLVDVWRAVPVCRELADTAYLPPAVVEQVTGELGELPSVFDLLCEVSYTRRDDRTDDLGGDGSPVQMRYSFEALVPGTRLHHGLVLRSTDPLIRGCLADAVETCSTWQSLGGRAAIGHGRYTWTWEQTIGRDLAAEADRYRDHIHAHADEIRDILNIPAGERA